jgi:hypothetical protein
MKFKITCAHVTGLALLLALGGCEKKETSGTLTESPSTNSLSATAAGLKDTAQQAVAEVRTTAENATAEAGRQVGAVTDQAQKLIDQAKSLIAERKYNEAWESLTRVSGLQLTADQKRVVEDLKAELQKLMANPGVSNAVNAARNLLK